MEFPGFLGNDEVKQALSTAFASRRFPHAIVLQGEKGCGKRTLASLLAKALVCRDREHAPCGVCPSCVRAAAGSHPDIRVEEGSGATRSLTVDMVRDVTMDAYRMPEEAEVSVYLLLMGSRTLEPAQNKLLKVIEEPPESAVFILVCESAEQLLPTIRSRVQSFTLRPPSQEEAAAWLREHAGVEEAEARRLAVLCGGNLGRMREELAGGGAAEAMSIALAITAGMTASNGHELLKAATPLQKDRKLFREVLSRLTVIFRDACALRAGGSAVLSGAKKEADKLGSLPMKQLSQLPGLVERYIQKLDRNANMTLLTASFCAQLRRLAGR